MKRCYVFPPLLQPRSSFFTVFPFLYLYSNVGLNQCFFKPYFHTREGVCVCASGRPYVMGTNMAISETLVFYGDISFDIYIYMCVNVYIHTRVCICMCSNISCIANPFPHLVTFISSLHKVFDTVFSYRLVSASLLPSLTIFYFHNS